jgi:ankyrin repeat protein
MIQQKNGIKVVFLVLIVICPLFLFTRELHKAVKEGKYEEVKMLIEKNPGLLNLKNSNCETPLLLAAKFGHFKIADLLITRGAKLNIRDRNNKIPLHYAAWTSEKLARLLIEKGADVNLKSNTGETPLFNYIYLGKKEMVEFLLKHGADINIKTNRGEMPIHQAAGKGDKYLVELLITNGAKINAVTTFNFTPLHFAVIFGHTEIVKLLIKNGADMNIKSNDGGTPLHFASAAKYPGIVELLKKNGAHSLPRKFPLLKGEYFGLKKPGLKPELFAANILFNISIFVTPTFSPDGKEVYFSLSSQHFQNSRIWYMKQKNQQWSPPERASFSGDYSEGSPVFSPDGKKLFFYSNMPINRKGPPGKDLDIWMVEREGKSWKEPKNIGFPVNTKKDDVAPSISKNGVLYFHRFEHTGSRTGAYIFRSKFSDGQYTIPEKLENAVNGEYGGVTPFIAPDESYIIFHSKRPGGYTPSNELYISFQTKMGTWTEAINMGKIINSFVSFNATVSPDGKFLFFFSLRNGGYRFYWVDAKIIEQLRPKELK